MKRFTRLTKFLLAMIIAITTISASAQAIQQDKFTDETYIGATIGYDAQVHPWDWNGMESGLRVGKFLTPYFGLEVQGQAYFRDFYKTIERSRVGANALLNLNYLGGYKGKTDLIEVVPFVGAGWQRTYVGPVHNNLYTKFGLDLNINLNDCLYLSIIPELAYEVSPRTQFNVNKADLGLSVGLTYRFKNSYGTHNFALCENEYSAEDWEFLNGKLYELQVINDELFHQNQALAEHLAMIPNEVVTKTIIDVVKEPIFATIGFEQNSANILGVYDLNVQTIASTIKESGQRYKIIGYASEEGPAEYNMELSLQRASVVRDMLVEYGADYNKLIVDGKGATTEFGQALDLNRTVQILMVTE